MKWELTWKYPEIREPEPKVVYGIDLFRDRI